MHFVCSLAYPAVDSTSRVASSKLIPVASLESSGPDGIRLLVGLGSGYSSVWDQDAKREQGAAKTRCIYDTGCVFCWCYVCWPMKHPETSVFDRSMSLVQYHPGGKCNDRLGFICTRYNLNTPVTCFVSKPSRITLVELPCGAFFLGTLRSCLLYTSPSPRD